MKLYTVHGQLWQRLPQQNTIYERRSLSGTWLETDEPSPAASQSLPAAEAAVPGAMAGPLVIAPLGAVAVELPWLGGVSGVT